MLAPPGAFGESFEVREFRKKWSVPPLLLPMGSKCLNQPRCTAVEEEEMPDHCHIEALEREQDWFGKLSNRTLGTERAHEKHWGSWKGNGKIPDFF